MNSSSRPNYKSLLHAMTLGDGYIYHPNGSNQYSLRIRHSVAQEAYLKHKIKLLEESLGGQISLRRGTQNGYPFVSMSKAHPYLKYVHKNVYQPKKVLSVEALSKLDLQGLCLWFMDDGSLSKKTTRGKPSGFEMRFCLYKSEEEIHLFNDWIQDRFGLRFTAVKGKGKYLSRCGTKEARKVRDLFSPFIIPSMSYKIDIPG